MTSKEIEILNGLKLVNEKAYDKWMSERIGQNFTFNHYEGNVKGVSVNILVICIETEEYFDLEWE